MPQIFPAQFMGTVTKHWGQLSKICRNPNSPMVDMCFPLLTSVEMYAAYLKVMPYFDGPTSMKVIEGPLLGIGSGGSCET